jgi:hypothetical protein
MISGFLFPILDRRCRAGHVVEKVKKLKPWQGAMFRCAKLRQNDLPELGTFASKCQ